MTTAVFKNHEKKFKKNVLEISMNPVHGFLYVDINTEAESMELFQSYNYSFQLILDNLFLNHLDFEFCHLV